MNVQYKGCVIYGDTVPLQDDSFSDITGVVQTKRYRELERYSGFFRQLFRRKKKNDSLLPGASVVNSSVQQKIKPQISNKQYYKDLLKSGNPRDRVKELQNRVKFLRIFPTIIVQQLISWKKVHEPCFFNETVFDQLDIDEQSPIIEIDTPETVRTFEKRRVTIRQLQKYFLIDESAIHDTDHVSTVSNRFPISNDQGLEKMTKEIFETNELKFSDTFRHKTYNNKYHCKRSNEFVFPFSLFRSTVPKKKFGNEKKLLGIRNVHSKQSVSDRRGIENISALSEPILRQKKTLYPETMRGTPLNVDDSSSFLNVKRRYPRTSLFAERFVNISDTVVSKKNDSLKSGKSEFPGKLDVESVFNIECDSSCIAKEPRTRIFKSEALQMVPTHTCKEHYATPSKMYFASEFDIATRNNDYFVAAAEVIVLTSSLGVNRVFHYKSIRLLNLLYIMGVAYLLFDLNREATSALLLLDVHHIQQWKQEKRLRLLADKSLLVPQLLIDGISIGDDIDAQDCADEGVLYDFFFRYACPKCWGPRNLKTSSCEFCKVSFTELVDFKKIQRGFTLECFKGFQTRYNKRTCNMYRTPDVLRDWLRNPRNCLVCETIGSRNEYDHTICNRCGSRFRECAIRDLQMKFKTYRLAESLTCTNCSYIGVPKEFRPESVHVGFGASGNLSYNHLNYNDPDYNYPENNFYDRKQSGLPFTTRMHFGTYFDSATCPRCNSCMTVGKGPKLRSSKQLNDSLEKNSPSHKSPQIYAETECSVESVDRGPFSPIPLFKYNDNPFSKKPDTFQNNDPHFSDSDSVSNEIPSGRKMTASNFGFDEDLSPSSPEQFIKKVTERNHTLFDTKNVPLDID